MGAKSKSAGKGGIGFGAITENESVGQTPKHRPHYAWLIFIGCCFTTAGGFALVYSLMGVYLLPVSESLGISTVDVSMWLTADGVMSLLAMPLAGRLLQKENMHRYMTMGSLVTAAGVLGFAFCRTRWHFMFCGCLTGFGMPYLYGIAQVTLIGNWFSVKRQGRFLGIAMACQGIAAAFWAPAFTQLIQAVGYQGAYCVNAALIVVLTVPWSIFVFRGTPSLLGMQPYGYKDDAACEDSKSEDAHVGLDRRDALRSAGFWLALIASCTVCLGMGFDNHQQAIAVEFFGSRGVGLLQAETYGSIMMSCCAIGTVVGDMLFGVLLDKLSLRRTFTIFLGLFFCAFLCWSMASASSVLLYVGSFLLGTHNGLASVGYPLLVRRLFGGRQFSKIYALVNMACSFVGGLTTAFVSYIYELVGTYVHLSWVAMFCVLVLALFSFFAIGRIGKKTWFDECGNPVSPFEGC